MLLHRGANDEEQDPELVSRAAQRIAPFSQGMYGPKVGGLLTPDACLVLVKEPYLADQLLEILNCGSILCIFNIMCLSMPHTFLPSSLL